jgi:lysophospholipase L1-like esterase
MRAPRFVALATAVAGALITTLVAVPAADAAPAAPDWAGLRAQPAYYLSLGDSLAFGYSDANYAKFQSDGDPADFHGYTEDLSAAWGVPAVNLSCPGETTTSMITTPCSLPAAPAPQLTEAVGYLSSHHLAFRRGIITVSIGSDDVLPIARQCVTDLRCPALQPALKTLRGNLATILGSLRRAAPFATIVVLAPYNPYGFADPISNLLAIQLDLSIAAVSVLHLDPVADGFSPINISLAAQHCSLIYFGCSQYGPFASDIHPTQAGYAVLAQAFEKAVR